MTAGGVLKPLLLRGDARAADPDTVAAIKPEITGQYDLFDEEIA